jgi:hypothetical protein
MPNPGDPNFPDYAARWKKIKPATLIESKLGPALQGVDGCIKSVWGKPYLDPRLSYGVQSLAYHVDGVLDLVRDTRKKCNPKLHKDAIKHLDLVEAKLLSLLAMNKARGEESHSLYKRIQGPLADGMAAVQGLTGKDGRKTVADLRLDKVKEAALTCAQSAKAYSQATAELVKKDVNNRSTYQARLDALVRAATITGELAKALDQKAKLAAGDDKGRAQLDARIESDFSGLVAFINELRGRRNMYGLDGPGT